MSSTVQFVGGVVLKDILMLFHMPSIFVRGPVSNLHGVWHLEHALHTCWRHWVSEVLGCHLLPPVTAGYGYLAQRLPGSHQSHGSHHIAMGW